MPTTMKAPCAIKSNRSQQALSRHKYCSSLSSQRIVSICDTELDTLWLFKQGFKCKKTRILVVSRLCYTLLDWILQTASSSFAPYLRAMSVTCESLRRVGEARVV